MKAIIKNEHLKIYIPEETMLLKGVPPLKLIRVSDKSYRIEHLLFTNGSLEEMEDTGIYIGYRESDLLRQKIIFKEERVYDFYKKDDRTYSYSPSEVVKIYTPKK